MENSMKWKTLKSEYLYKSPFGNLRKDECQLPNGFVLNEYYVNEYPDWVNAIVITKENKVVLVEQYRHAGGEFYLEVPAGKMDENETYEEGILRELREETGFTSSIRPIKLGEFKVNPATQTNKVITYLIVDAYKGSGQDLDENEDLRVHLYDFNDLGKAIKENSIRTQLFTASAYYMAKDFLSENSLNYIKEN